MKDHYQANAILCDRRIARQLQLQCMDEHSPLYGAVENMVLGYTSANDGGVGPASAYILAYYTPASAYYRQEMLMRRAQLALEYALRLQNEDGTLDLPQTNFHDAAETAFAVGFLYPAASAMAALRGDSAVETVVWQRLQRLCDGFANGILAGGFHTPNHRWVISAACAILARIVGRTDCLDYMRQFLAEGIDCDENGEFTERSAGTYNYVCDRALFYLAQEANMPELYAHIERNLRMMLCYFEPDETINTMNSTRQDNGTRPSATYYYGIYLAMALQTGDAQFAAVADRMLACLQANLVLNADFCQSGFDFLHLFLLNPALSQKQAAICAQESAPDCNRFFASSGVARYRAGEFSATLVQASPDFLKLQFGTHAMTVRLAGCFYARGQFAAQRIEAIEGGYRLYFHDRWGYKRPLPTPQGTSDWRKMDHSQRLEAMMRDFDYCVEVFLRQNGATVRFACSGCENVPLKLEFILEPNGKYAVNDVELWLRKGAYVYQKCGESRYWFADRRSLRISGGFCAHTYGENMRGTLGGEPERATIAMTAYSPCEQEVALVFE